MHRIGQGDLSCKKARDVGVDAIRSGACGNRLKNFIGTGTNGEHEQNLEREMYAQCLKQLNLPDLIYDVQVFDPQDEWLWNLSSGMASFTPTRDFRIDV